jgi:ABC-type transporter Mla maintaining outer membrane lipid asymmetry permease subunit MlaE
VGKRNLLFPLLSSLGIFGGMVCTVVFRDQVRLEYIKPYLDIASIPVNAQWGMLALFLMALVVALALLVVLMVKVLPKIAEGARERLEKTIAAGRT